MTESFTNCDSVGQSSNSSFGSTLSFGQSTAAKNNSLAPKRFGSTFSLGSQSMSGGTSPGAIRSSQSSPTLTSRPDFGVSRLTSFGSSKPTFEQGRKGDAKRGETMSGSSTNCGGKSLGNRSSKAGPVGRLGSLRSALASSSLLAGREQRSREEEKRSEEVLGLSTNSFGQSSFSLKEELARIDAFFVDKESDDSGPRWWESTCWRAGESKALVFEFGADIEALLPKLRHAYYYIVPRLEELAAIEKAELGYCSRVKNFVVGRYHFGSIRFIGETDVRGLDLESIIQFNDREVTVYMDDAKKPPVGQGLNKRAKISLYNVNCVDEVTGRECMEGNTLDKFVDVLKKKAEDLGAEFVSYDPYEAVWKFKVGHF